MIRLIKVLGLLFLLAIPVLIGIDAFGSAHTAKRSMSILPWMTIAFGALAWLLWCWEPKRDQDQP